MSDAFYLLEVNGKGKHNTFEFKTKEQVGEAYRYLVSMFDDQMIVDKNSFITSGKEIIQLTYSEVFTSHVSNRMASFVPEEWFSIDIYEELLEEARKFYEKSNKN